MKVLVLGASGFVGRHLVQVLQEHGHDPHAMVRRPSAGWACPVTVEPSTTEPALTRLMALVEPDVVINLAAAGVRPTDRDVSELADTNVSLPTRLAMAAAAAGVPAVLHVGSSAEYAAARPGDLLTESAPLERTRLYGASKAAGSLFVQAVGAQRGVAVAVPRLFNVFGPGEPDHRLFPALVTRLGQGVAVPLSPGEQLRDFMHVREAAEAITELAKCLAASPSVAGCYNVATGIGLSVADFARAVARAMNADPGLLKFGAIAMRPDDLGAVVGDPRRLREETGWTSRLRLEQAIDLAVARARAAVAGIA